MALSHCLDCGREVSTRARHCVHCGRPWPATKCSAAFVVAGLVSGILVAAIVLMLGVCRSRGTCSWKEEADVRIAPSAPVESPERR